jgi:hypothetical protein
MLQPLEKPWLTTAALNRAYAHVRRFNVGCRVHFISGHPPHARRLAPDGYAMVVLAAATVATDLPYQMPDLIPAGRAGEIINTKRLLPNPDT